MEANILKGVYIQVGGKAGETNGLAWHIIENMFGHLQSLIESLAKYELVTEKSPNLKEFEIEIFDFKPGSAVPAFRLIPKSQRELIPIVEEQKMVVANRFDELMSYANRDNYENFFKEEQLPEVRYEIGEDLYGFIHSADNSPLAIVKPMSDNGKLVYEEIYKVPPFTKDQAEYLLKPKRRRRAADEPEEILALIQRTGKRKRIIDLYENKDTILSIAPLQIVTDNKVYHLHNPLLCTVHKEDGNFIIQNEMLDLYAAGLDIDSAEHDLYQEFDASHQLLNSLSDEELSERLIRAKYLMNAYIKEITEN